MGKDFIDDFYNLVDPLGTFDLDDDGEYSETERFLVEEEMDETQQRKRKYDDFDEDDFDEDDFDEDDFDDDI